MTSNSTLHDNDRPTRKWAVASPFVVGTLFLLGGWWMLAGDVVFRAYALLLFTFSALIASAWMLWRRVLPDRTAAAMFAASICTVGAGWMWQRLEYLSLPGKFLAYGYFKTGPGAQARFSLLELPLSLVSMLLLAECVAMLIAGCRSGLRWSLVSLVAWFAVAIVAFALPSLSLYLQGDAAIFI